MHTFIEIVVDKKIKVNIFSYFFRANCTISIDMHSLNCLWRKFTRLTSVLLKPFISDTNINHVIAKSIMSFVKIPKLLSAN